MSDPFSPSDPRASSNETPAELNVETPSGPVVSEAVVKFKSCRWRRPPEDGPECCGHRDVLPIAGTNFNPEAWCPDCQFFKLRRTPKKRNPDEYRY